MRIRLSLTPLLQLKHAASQTAAAGVLFSSAIRSIGPIRPIMKLALNGATTMRADLPTDLQAAKAAGFDYVEIWAAKLRNFLRERSTAELADLFAETSLKPLSINSIEHITFRQAHAYESIKHQCEELSSIAAAVGRSEAHTSELQSLAYL